MRARIAVVLLAVLAVLPACEKVNSVASSVSPCFRVLPQARAAVGGQGTFVDVARVSRSALPRFGRLGLARRPPGTVPPVTPGSTIVGQSGVCLVAYKGTFDPTKIVGLVGPARSGHYAVVVVGIRAQRVRAVALVDKLPSPLHNR